MSPEASAWPKLRSFPGKLPQKSWLGDHVSGSAELPDSTRTMPLSLAKLVPAITASAKPSPFTSAVATVAPKAAPSRTEPVVGFTGTRVPSGAGSTLSPAPPRKM
ncbi:hypothetical protein NQZ70_05927 [Sorangium sp. Soce836]|nr:hypothetical protein NQZ70_05927 [Sorangium sp. Soce836]